METSSIVEFLNALAQRLGEYLPSALGALAILIVGGILAKAVSRGVGRLATRSMDNKKVVDAVAGSGTLSDPEEKSRLINGVEHAVFWILSLVVLVAFFSVLKVPALSSALATAVEDLVGYLPNLLGAVAVLVVAWVLARILRFVVTTALSALPWVRNLEARVQPDDEDRARRLPEAVGGLVFWLVLLFAIPAFLGALAIESLERPFQGMIDQILVVLPGVAVAAFILFVGFLFAKIIRNVVVHFLDAIDMQGWLEGVGLGKVVSQIQLHQAIGTVVYVLVLLPVIENALDRLAIRSLSEPLGNVIHEVVSIVPSLASFLILLIIGILLGRWLGGVVSGLLGQLGFDAVWSRLGVGSSEQAAHVRDRKSLSNAVGQVLAAVITVLLAAQAFEVLNLAVMSDLLRGLVEFLPQVLIAVVIVGFALFLGNALASAVEEIRGREGSFKWLPVASRWVVVGLGFLMALDQLGIGGSVLDTGFAVLLASVGLGLALAFGLGGREWAGRCVDRWTGTSSRDEHRSPKTN